MQLHYIQNYIIQTSCTARNFCVPNWRQPSSKSHFFSLSSPKNQNLSFSAVSVSCLQSIVLILSNEGFTVHSAWLLAGSGLTSPKLPGWCLSFAMIHKSNTVTGTWARPIWTAGTGRLFSPLEDKERGT